MPALPLILGAATGLLVTAVFVGLGAVRAVRAKRAARGKRRMKFLERQATWADTIPLVVHGPCVRAVYWVLGEPATPSQNRPTALSTTKTP